MNFETGMTYLVVIALLIILGLLLKQWEPPIKKQYVVMILLVTGGALGYFVVKNLLLGVAIAGLVFYKDEFVEELKLVKECITDIKKNNEKRGD